MKSLPDKGNAKRQYAWHKLEIKKVKAERGVLEREGHGPPKYTRKARWISLLVHNGPSGSAQHFLHIVRSWTCAPALLLLPAGWMDVVGDVDSGAETKTLPSAVGPAGRRAGFAHGVTTMGDAGRACRWHVSIQSSSCFQSGPASQKHGRVPRRPDRRWPCSGCAGGLTGCEALVVVGLLQM